LIKEKNVQIIKTQEKSADQAIINLSNKNTIVATNDKLLRQKLKDRNAKTIYLKSKKHLEMR
jgi:rRNA-processing protein FCF1